MARDSSLQMDGRCSGISVNNLRVPRSMLSTGNASSSLSPAQRSPKAPQDAAAQPARQGELVLTNPPQTEEGRGGGDADAAQCVLPPIHQSPTVSRGSSALTPCQYRHDRDRSLSGHLSRARTTTMGGPQTRTPGRVHSTASASGTFEDEETDTLFRAANKPVPHLAPAPLHASAPQQSAAPSAVAPQRNRTTQGRIQGDGASTQSPMASKVIASQPVKLPPVRNSWEQVDAELTAAQESYAKRFRGPNSSNPVTTGVGLVPLLEQCATGKRSAMLALRSLTTKLCDFGCAIHSAGPGYVPLGKSGKGSTSYCSPEVSVVYLQGKNRPAFDAFWPDSEAVFAQMYAGYDSCLADVWSFGVTLFVVASGRLPFRVASVDSGTFRAFVRATQPHVAGDELMAPRTVSWAPEAEGAPWSWPRSFSPALKHLLRGCLAVRPEERFSMEQAKGHPWFGNPRWVPPLAAAEQGTGIYDSTRVYV